MQFNKHYCTHFLSATACRGERGTAAEGGVSGGDAGVHFSVPHPWPTYSSALQRWERAADHPSGSSLQHSGKVQWHHWKGTGYESVFF